MRGKRLLGWGLTPLAVGLISLTVIPSAMAGTSWTYAEQVVNYTNVFGQVVVTTDLYVSWKYSDNHQIVWYMDPPTYTVKKPWWAWNAEISGQVSGTHIVNPNVENLAFGSCHYTVWIGAYPWHEDLYTEIYYFGDGYWYSQYGFGYVT